MKLDVSIAGSDPFVVPPDRRRRATHYVLKVNIGGLPVLVAPLVGKEPADSHVWIHDGEAPAFVTSEAPLFLGGPVVRTELARPVWR